MKKELNVERVVKHLRVKEERMNKAEALEGLIKEIRFLSQEALEFNNDEGIEAIAEDTEYDYERMRKMAFSLEYITDGLAYHLQRLSDRIYVKATEVELDDSCQNESPNYKKTERLTLRDVI